MTGRIFIRGNLYITDDLYTSELHENGIAIHVRKDVIFKCNYEDIKSKMDDDDVFIEGLFDKFRIRDVIAYSPLPIN